MRRHHRCRARGVIGFVAFIDYDDLSDIESLVPAGVDVSVGIGLWLTLVGGITMALVSVAGILERR